MADTQTMTSESGHVYYKKMAPSQVRRNYERRQNWISSKNNPKSGDISSSDNVHIESQVCNDNITNRSGQEPGHVNRSSITGGLFEINQSRQTQMPHLNNHPEQGPVTDLCDITADQNIAMPKQSISQSEDTDSSSCSSEESNDTLPECMEGVCDICSKSFPTSNPIWTCTQCDNYAICFTCKDADQVTHDHSCAKDQLHMYNIPGLIKCDCNCDSCGAFIPSLRSKLFECMMCENFILCPRCHQEGMHKNHKSRMIEKTKREYKSS